MSAVILFVCLGCIAAYIVWCDERDQYELAIKRLTENGNVRLVYAIADEFVHSASIATFKLVLQVYSTSEERT